MICVTRHVIVWTAAMSCYVCVTYRLLSAGGRGGFRGGRGGDRGGRGGGRGRGDFKPKMKIDAGSASGSKVTFD